MLAVATQVTVALIGAFGIVGAATVTGPIVWYLKRVDRRNTDQHKQAADAREMNHKVLDKIQEDMHHVRGVVVEHISWHAHGVPEPTQESAKVEIDHK